MSQSPILNGYIHIMCVLIMDLRVNSGIVDMGGFGHRVNSDSIRNGGAI